MIDFKPFPKMARLSREILISEKLDGTNASVTITPVALGGTENISEALGVFDGYVVYAGSRNRWITPAKDNYGFAAWALANVTELLKLGVGTHFGEFWGAGIQRRYGLAEKRFSLFNVNRWGGCPQNDWKYIQDLATGVPGPSCCSVVPILYRGDFSTGIIEETLARLGAFGSVAAPGFRDPEGIVIFHTAAGVCFKKTLKNDALPKSLV